MHQCRHTHQLLIAHMKMLDWFRNRHFQLHDDADDSAAADSSRSLLPHSQKTAFRAFMAQMIMICALVSASSVSVMFALFVFMTCSAQVHRSSMRNMRSTIVGGCTVTLVVRAIAPLPRHPPCNVITRPGHVRVSAAEHRGSLPPYIHNPG